MIDSFASIRFPLSSKYNPDWIRASVSGGANPLWLTEWLTEVVKLSPGMRVLDLGCGRCMSSIFLQKEYGVQVWAIDLLISATENFQRIKDAGVSENVFPLHSDARSLPFPSEFFDVIISIDSFFYYGTDDLYLNDLMRFLKPGGQLAIAGAGLIKEFGGIVPEHLRNWWTQDLWCLHSAAWWRQHWEKTELVDVVVADSMDDGWEFWLAWHKAIAPDNALEIEAITKDHGEYMGYVRTTARKRTGILIDEPIVALPYNYTEHSILR